MSTNIAFMCTNTCASRPQMTQKINTQSHAFNVLAQSAFSRIDMHRRIPRHPRANSVFTQSCVCATTELVLQNRYRRFNQSYKVKLSLQIHTNMSQFTSLLIMVAASCICVSHCFVVMRRGPYVPFVHHGPESVLLLGDLKVGPKVTGFVFFLLFCTSYYSVVTNIVVGSPFIISKRAIATNSIVSENGWTIETTTRHTNQIFGFKKRILSNVYQIITTWAMNRSSHSRESGCRPAGQAEAKTSQSDMLVQVHVDESSAVHGRGE